MLSILRMALRALCALSAAAWLSGCVIHAEHGHADTPVKEKHGQSEAKHHAKPPASSDDAQPAGESDDSMKRQKDAHNPPPPPPPK